MLQGWRKDLKVGSGMISLETVCAVGQQELRWEVVHRERKAKARGEA